jgi:hypothetical protein
MLVIQAVADDLPAIFANGIAGLAMWPPLGGLARQ